MAVAKPVRDDADGQAKFGIAPGVESCTEQIHAPAGTLHAAEIRRIVRLKGDCIHPPDLFLIRRSSRRTCPGGAAGFLPVLTIRARPGDADLARKITSSMMVGDEIPIDVPDCSSRD